ncbi:MAG: hypothetical protein IT204_21020 [Fimbriimonadaceae bacterium]|nr:hypothetical protein [Fimbriimonadaceae bacterium]
MWAPWLLLTLTAADPPANLTMEQVVAETMRPYAGPSVAGVDRTTLRGKVLCGYQGWFTAPGDGAGRGWFHWGRGSVEAGRATFDLWPDVSELAADERFATPHRHPDGRPAELFSSVHPQTVARHFQWMQQYGLDGVFVQRFASQVRSPVGRRHCNLALANCRRGANLHGRTYAVMYDMNWGAEDIEGVKQDWRELVDRMQITRDPAYLHEGGQPVLALWGCAFTHYRWDAAAAAALLDWLQHDPTYGGLTVMLGVPTDWRTLNGDCRPEPAVHEVYAKADILSPWMVGRFGTPAARDQRLAALWPADRAWCAERGKTFLPVVWPGFSWHNLKPESKLNAIPRLGGEFLWGQVLAAKTVGCDSLYVAMFDEVDEGTAIFKCVSDPPEGFLGYEGLPSDHYLWLTGQAGRLLRGELPLSRALPTR